MKLKIIRFQLDIFKPKRFKMSKLYLIGNSRMSYVCIVNISIALYLFSFYKGVPKKM